MKKIFTLIAAMLLVPWVGWGQEETIKISTAEELRAFAEKVNSGGGSFNAELTADIDLNGNESNQWTPIGTNYHVFHGVFEGNNHTISGLYIKETNGEENDYLGLFGYAGSAAIRNLNVVGHIEGTNACVGGIVALSEGNCSISHCSFDGKIITKEVCTVGGICGTARQMTTGTTIEYCYNVGDIDAAIENIDGATFSGLQLPFIFYYIGGIAGYADNISNCYNAGDIEVQINKVLGKDGGNAYLYFIGVGGIGQGDMSSCYNIGNITASGDNNKCMIGVGGLYGIGSSTIQYSYNYGKVNSNITNIEAPSGTDKCYGEGIVLGLDGGLFTFEDVYYIPQNKIEAVGGNYYDESVSYENLIQKTEDEFEKGEVAYLLREYGYGQDLQDASITSPTLLAFTPGKEVYKLTLDYSGYNNEGQKEQFANSGFLNLPELVATETEKEVGWYDENGTLYTSTSAISDDITLYAKKQTLHNITIEATEGGSVSADKKQAIVGETITLAVTPDEGYALESISATTEEGAPVDITDNTFIMPDADVTVSATFAKVKYTVTIGELTNGSITIGEEGKTEAVFVPGDPVSLNITPDEGYDIDQLFLNDVEITGTTFEMPAANVVVTATFKLKPVEDDDEDTGAIKKRYRLYLADQDFYLNDEYDEAGLVLYSRHDKKYTDVGGSFTIWFEKHGEVNEGARVFISNRANGEYKEVKLDEVSGYYQIRNVQSNIYVKLYTEEGFPVANEAIEATETRAYAQANKIVVVTPEPTEVQIISMAGAVVATAQVAGQQEFANLAEGVYIVRMGKSVVKLQVRN